MMEDRAFRRLRGYLFGELVAPQDVQAFVRYRRAMSVRGMELVGYILLFGNLLFWPTDLWLFRHSPEGLRAFALWRLVLTLCCTFGLLLLRLRPVRKHRAVLWIFAICVLLTATTGGLWISRLGGLDQPFFYAIYTFAGVSMALLVPLWLRIMFTYCTTALFLLGFFGSHPQHLKYPHLPSVMMVLISANGAYVLIGHVIYLLSKKTFLQGQALSRAAAELAIESQKSERLLLNVLPAAIAARLKEDQKPIADGFGNVTVLFADIVGFTQLSASLPPHALVQLLNGVFSEFDQAAERLGLEKIKTIGDAYMVAGGLPSPRPDHAIAVADMALCMREIVGRYAGKNGAALRLRVGIHSGPVVAGVIGARKFIYDLWGDTVNTASRMESHGLPDEIQVSEATHDLLVAHFRLTARGPIEIKGLGPMPTWFLNGRRIADSAGGAGPP
jgi:class 3 adenylate cyclase